MAEQQITGPVRRQFERDVTAEPSISAKQLTGYSDEPGYAIPPGPESDG